MKLHELLKEIIEDQPIAIVSIVPNGENFTSRIYGRTDEETVDNIIMDLAEQIRLKGYNEVKNQLPF